MSAVTILIQDLRRAGLSQSDIARRTGIPQPRISRWESGHAPAAADDSLRLRQLHSELAERPDAPKPAQVAA